MHINFVPFYGQNLPTNRFTHDLQYCGPGFVYWSKNLIHDFGSTLLILLFIFIILDFSLARNRYGIINNYFQNKCDDSSSHIQRVTFIKNIVSTVPVHYLNFSFSVPVVSCNVTSSIFGIMKTDTIRRDFIFWLMDISKLRLLRKTDHHNQHL